MTEDLPSGPKQQQFDPRKLNNDLWPKGTGKTPYEVYREAFAVTPTKFQINHMNENVTDLDKWRSVTQQCALKGWKSYDNVFDAYKNGFRNSPNQPDQPSTKPKQLLTLKRWCFEKYNIDNPKFVRDVPEDMVHAEYELYRQQYFNQQAH